VKLLSLAACLLLGAATASAGPSQPRVRSSPDPGPAIAPEVVLSRTIERIALMDLRLQPNPGDVDYRIADHVLELAQRVSPDRATLARRRASLAYRIGDSEALERATRDVVRLDPRDTVAQLRLISLRIRSLQTVDQRLDAYQRFLGPGGRSLDPSVRSRLALDAALLAREAGRTDTFVDMLSLATQLDATNKQAAAVALGFYQQRVADDPRGLAELTINLLLADPLDLNVHLALARILAAHGVFDQADRFHTNGRRVMLAASNRLTTQVSSEQLVLTWHRFGPDRPVSRLHDELTLARNQARERIASLQAQGIPTTDQTPPEQVRLDPQIELVRILAAHAAGQEDVIEAAVEDLRASHDAEVRGLTDPATRPEGVTPAQVRALAGARLFEQFAIRSMTGVQLDEYTDAVRGTPLRQDPRVRQATDPWIALREGRLDDAIAGFESLDPAGPVVHIGIGLAHELGERIQDAVESYRAAFASDPLGPWGAWGRYRAGVLIKTDPVRTTLTAPIRRAAQAVPDWVDQITSDPVAATNLTVQGPGRSLHALEPGHITLRLRNAAPTPLGLGPDHTIRSTFVISPQLDAPGVDEDWSPAHPEIVELDRRLRLNPRETIEAQIETMPAFTGWWLEVASEAAARVRHRVIQGVDLSAGTLRVGALSVAADADAYVRQPLELVLAGPEAIADAARTGTGHTLALALASMRTLALRPEHTGAAPGDLDTAIDAIIQRFDSLSSIDRALTLAMLPTGRLAPKFERLDLFIDDAMAHESDEIVLGVALATRARSSDDPLLRVAPIERSAWLTELAGLIRERLDAGHEGYPTRGPGVRALEPFRIDTEPGG